MTTKVPEQPLPPAVAYGVMENLLGPGFFLRQPPGKGALLQVVGNDGISTQWAMSVQEAQRLMEPLRVDDRIVRVIPSRYDSLRAT